MSTKVIDKKTMLAAILTTGLTFAISQAALAAPGEEGQPAVPSVSEVMPAPPYHPDRMALEQKDTETRNTFLDETVTLRKQLAEKKTVLRAIMAAGAPDTVQAGQVAGEIFDIQEQLRVKARATGMSLPMLLWGECDAMPYHPAPPPRKKTNRPFETKPTGR